MTPQYGQGNYSCFNHIEVHSNDYAPIGSFEKGEKNVLQYGRGNWIRTSDLDFKDRCLRPLGDTPTYALL